MKILMHGHPDHQGALTSPASLCQPKMVCIRGAHLHDVAYRAIHDRALAQTQPVTPASAGARLAKSDAQLQVGSLGWSVIDGMDGILEMGSFGQCDRWDRCATASGILGIECEWPCVFKEYRGSICPVECLCL